MPDLVTLPETKSLLRISFTDDDPALNLLITAASSAVISYLQGGGFQVLTVDGEVIEDLPAEIRTGTIMLVGYLFEHPDQDPDKAFEGGRFPASVTSLLRPLRKPTLA